MLRFAAYALGMIAQLVNGVFTGFLMCTGYMGQVKNKGLDYYACLAVQGTAMIITFTSFGVYFDKTMAAWFGNPWACSLILGSIGILLALIVVFVLLPGAADKVHKRIDFLEGNFRSLLAFFAQIAIVQIYFQPKSKIDYFDS